MLKVENLHVRFGTKDQGTTVVRGVSYEVKRGEVVSLLGESGSGKSVSVMSAIRLYDAHAAHITADVMQFETIDLLKSDAKTLNALRGKHIGLVFQNPGDALSPNKTIRAQFKELCTVHSIPWKESEIVDLLCEVGLSEEAERLLSMYPHQLSGGQAQRVTIAMAVLPKPELLIADEPTSSIDASLTGVIVDLLLALQKKMGLGLLFITHDFDLAARISDRIIIMYGGLVMETGTREAVFNTPQHPYTLELMRCVQSLRSNDGHLYTLNGYALDPSDFTDACPFAKRCSEADGTCEQGIPGWSEIEPGHEVRCIKRKERLSGKEEDTLKGNSLERTPFESAQGESNATKQERDLGQREPVDGTVLTLEDISKTYHVKRSFFGKYYTVQAVKHLNLTVKEGETLGIIGESGSGKSTLSQLILGLIDADGGHIRFEGIAPEFFRRDVQVVFQYTYGALDPLKTIFELISEPIKRHKIVYKGSLEEEVTRLLRLVGLSEGMLFRKTNAISGGQKQRIGIARALASRPKFLVLDEPVSALDVSVQGQIINLLADLKRRLGLTYLFITHDLTVAAHLSDRIAVMYRGEIVEIGETEQIVHAPKADYTKRLMNGVRNDRED
jgi:peptide/nickel transport system ATP-binding protein